MFLTFDTKKTRPNLGTGFGARPAGASFQAAAEPGARGPGTTPSELKASRPDTAETTLRPLLPAKDASGQNTVRPRGKRKLKLGCLTCKCRKKKCDETKPVCRDCRRFGKNCVWVDPDTMSGHQIKQLRQQVQQQERNHKLRRKAPVEDREGEKARSGAAFSAQASPPEPWSDPLVAFNHDTPLQGEFPLQEDHSFEKALEDDRSFEKVLQNGPSGAAAPTNTPGSAAWLASQLAVASPAFGPKHDGAVDPGALMGFLGQSPGPAYPTQGSSKDSAEAADAGLPILLLMLGLLRSMSHQEGYIEELDEDGSPVLPNLLEQMHAYAQDSPAHAGHLDDFAAHLNNIMVASPVAPPSLLPDLDRRGFQLYTYYVDVLLQKVLIAPCTQNESNSYQKVFLPLAQKDKGVLFGILAWAGFHMGGEWLAEGNKYAEMAVNHFRGGLDLAPGSSLATDRQTVVYNLAAVLILCGAEICRGDVKFWSRFLEWGWRLLRDNGGILNFDNNKEEHWLILNFAYHDLLASTAADRGPFFPSETYDVIIHDPSGISSGNLNPLLGVMKLFFKVIGDISKLRFEIKLFMANPDSPGCADLHEQLAGSMAGYGGSKTKGRGAEEAKGLDRSEHSRMLLLFSYVDRRAAELETTIDGTKPDAADLEDLSDSDLELQLTTFEAFQLASKLYLRQAILKLNPLLWECQMLVHDLIKCLDVLIELPMQAAMVFPIFIAGIFTVTDAGRDAMRHRYDTFMRIYGPWNVVRVKALVEHIWRENPQGDKVVDWHAVLNDLGWEINFA